MMNRVQVCDVQGVNSSSKKGLTHSVLTWFNGTSFQLTDCPSSAKSWGFFTPIKFASGYNNLTRGG